MIFTPNFISSNHHQLHLYSIVRRFSRSRIDLNKWSSKHESLLLLISTTALLVTNAWLISAVFYIFINTAVAFMLISWYSFPLISLVLPMVSDTAHYNRLFHAPLERSSKRVHSLMLSILRTDPGIRLETRRLSFGVTMPSVAAPLVSVCIVVGALARVN